MPVTTTVVHHGNKHRMAAVQLGDHLEAGSEKYALEEKQRAERRVRPKVSACQCVRKSMSLAKVNVLLMCYAARRVCLPGRSGKVWHSSGLCGSCCIKPLLNPAMSVEERAQERRRWHEAWAARAGSARQRHRRLQILMCKPMSYVLRHAGPARWSFS